MPRGLARFFPIRPGEGLITLLMFLYIFGVLTFYYILKPLKDGLFLANYPSSDLPYPNFLAAIIAGTVATLIFKLGRRLSAIRLLTATNLAIVGTLCCFFLAIGRETQVMPYVFFVYVSIVSVLSTAQFWLIASYIYDNQQAKRLYGLLGAGAIAGALAGSFVPGVLSKRWNLTTETMLLLCIAICLVLIVLSNLAWRIRRPEAEMKTDPRRHREPRESFQDLTRMVFGSRHLYLMALLVFLTLIASQIADWQIKDALYSKFKFLSSAQRKEEITAFLGQFYLVTNVLGITLQLLVTGFIVRRFGIGVTILFLPSGLFLASLGVLVAPSLITTLTADGVDAVFRYSINRAGFELLYMPLSATIRKRLKLFIDVFIDRFGRFVAALILLGFTKTYFPMALRVRGTAVVALLLTGISIVVCLKLRKSYVNSFRQQLTRSDVDLTDVDRYVTDTASVQLLMGALDSPQERQILYSLRLLQSVRGTDLSPQLLPLLRHASPIVRAEAVRTLKALPGDHLREVEPLLQDSSDEVRVAAVEYVCTLDPANAAARLQSLMEHESTDVRLSAVRWAADRSEASFRPSLEFVRGLLALEGPIRTQARAAAAQLAARLPHSESLAVIKELLEDPEPKVVGSVARAAARAGHLELIFQVLPMLQQRNLRREAREALIMFGSRATGTLGDVLADPHAPLALRREIPWVLGRIPTQTSANILLDNLNVEDPLLKYRVVKALNRLHDFKPELPGRNPRIADRIFAETKGYYQALALRQALVPGNGPHPTSLLGRALRERLDQNLEIIFRLLGLEYPQKDIYWAYTAIKAARSDRRGAAIEFLDNVLQKNLKSIILPLLEESSADLIIERTSHIFGIQSRGREESLLLILELPDTWLKACALHEIGEKRLTALTHVCQRFSTDGEPLIHETAEWALKRVST